MASKKHTHVAINTIQTHENGKAVEYAPGMQFTPNKDELERLLEKRAVRAVTSDDVETTNTTPDNGAAPPDGYSPGTAGLDVAPGLDGTENDVVSEDSEAAAARAPASRTTLGARR